MSKRNEAAWCCRCRKETTWSGTERRLYCSGCGTDFPCAHNCAHWDCLEAKGFAVADEAGVLRKVASGGPDVTVAADSTSSDRDDLPDSTTGKPSC